MFRARVQSNTNAQDICLVLLQETLYSIAASTTLATGQETTAAQCV